MLSIVCRCLLSCKISRTCYTFVWWKWKREELEWYFDWNSYAGSVSTTLISLCWLSCSTGRVQRAVLPLAHFRQRNGARPHTRQQITISCATIDCATISSWCINITTATSSIDSGTAVSVSISYCVSNARRVLHHVVNNATFRMLRITRFMILNSWSNSCTRWLRALFCFRWSDKNRLRETLTRCLVTGITFAVRLCKSAS